MLLLQIKSRKIASAVLLVVGLSLFQTLPFLQFWYISGAYAVRVRSGRGKHGHGRRGTMLQRTSQDASTSESNEQGASLASPDISVSAASAAVESDERTSDETERETLRLLSPNPKKVALFALDAELGARLGGGGLSPVGGGLDPISREPTRTPSTCTSSTPAGGSLWTPSPTSEFPVSDENEFRQLTDRQMEEMLHTVPRFFPARTSTRIFSTGDSDRSCTSSRPSSSPTFSGAGAQAPAPRQVEEQEHQHLPMPVGLPRQLSPHDAEDEQLIKEISGLSLSGGANSSSTSSSSGCRVRSNGTRSSSSPAGRRSPVLGSHPDHRLRVIAEADDASSSSAATGTGTPAAPVVPAPAEEDDDEKNTVEWMALLNHLRGVSRGEAFETVSKMREEIEAERERKLRTAPELVAKEEKERELQWAQMAKALGVPRYS